MINIEIPFDYRKNRDGVIETCFRKMYIIKKLNKKPLEGFFLPKLNKSTSVNTPLYVFVPLLRLLLVNHVNVPFSFKKAK